MMSLGLRSATMCLSALLASAGTSCVMNRTNKPQGTLAFKRMLDGKAWLTENLTVAVAPSYCYDDDTLNCRQYGRLYTWESATRGCQALGEEWRLPTKDEWNELAKYYGGVGNETPAGGRAAYRALVLGGSAGFNAVLGGGRDAARNQYARREAHGFYWTGSEADTATAWFYNFAKGSQALYRQDAGEKQRAFSVRCVRD